MESSTIVAEGLKSVISNIGDVEIIDTVSDPELLRMKISTLSPDILIINPMMLDVNTRHSIRSTFGLPEEMTVIAESFSLPDPEILKHVHTFINIFDSKNTIISKITESVSDKKSIPDNEIDGLSEREREILVSLVSGKTNKEVAEEHNISVHTVISHRRNISKKTGIKSVSGLTIYAMLNGLIEPGETKMTV